MTGIKKAKIGIYHYDVIYRDEILNDSGVRLYGDICEAEQLIRISNGLSELRQMETLLHESLHGINYASQIGLKETQVSAVSTRLLEFMRDNKKIIEYLIS